MCLAKGKGAVGTIANCSLNRLLSLMPAKPSTFQRRLSYSQTSLGSFCNLGNIDAAVARINGSGDFHLFASKLFRFLLVVYLI